MYKSKFQTRLKKWGVFNVVCAQTIFADKHYTMFCIVLMNYFRNSVLKNKDFFSSGRVMTMKKSFNKVQNRILLHSGVRKRQAPWMKMNIWDINACICIIKQTNKQTTLYMVGVGGSHTSIVRL